MRESIYLTAWTKTAAKLFTADHMKKLQMMCPHLQKKLSQKREKKYDVSSGHCPHLQALACKQLERVWNFLLASSFCFAAAIEVWAGADNPVLLVVPNHHNEPVIEHVMMMMRMMMMIEMVLIRMNLAQAERKITPPLFASSPLIIVSSFSERLPLATWTLEKS